MNNFFIKNKQKKNSHDKLLTKKDKNIKNIRKTFTDDNSFDEMV